MSKNKHTPGPYTAEFLDQNFHFGVRANDGDLIAVGCLKADAELFAAAPELLTRVKHNCDWFGEAMETLNLCLEQLKNSDDKLRHGDYHKAEKNIAALYEYCRDMLNECARDIAKAEGK